MVPADSTTVVALRDVAISLKDVQPESVLPILRMLLGVIVEISMGFSVGNYVES